MSLKTFLISPIEKVALGLSGYVRLRPSFNIVLYVVGRASIRYVVQSSSAVNPNDFMLLMLSS